MRQGALDNVVETAAGDDALDDSTDAATRHESAAPRAVDVTATLVALGLVSVVVPLAIAHHYGALGVARGDDWSYLRTLFNWVDGRGLNFNNWVSMTLLGQLVIAAPVALATNRDIASMQVLTAVIGFVGLCGVLSLAHTVTRRFAAAVLVASVVALGPLWPGLSTTFMTDIPGCALAIVSAAIGVRSLRGSGGVRLGLLVTSLCVGWLAFTIREYAAAPAAAVLLVAFVTARRAGDRRTARVCVTIAAVAIVAALAFLAYWHGVPGGKPFSPAFPTSHSLSTSNFKGAGMLRLVGLWLAPVLLYAGPVRIVRRAWAASPDVALWLTLIVGAWLAATGVDSPRIAFAGNYFIPNGFLGNGVSTGTRPDLVPPIGFWLLIGCGTAAALVLVLAAIPSLVGGFRSRRGASSPVEVDLTAQVLWLTLAIYTVGYVLAALLTLPLYDRYVLPIVPLAAVLVVRQASLHPAGGSARARLAIAVAATAVMGVISFVYAADSASFDAVRWHVSAAAVRAGWQPQQVAGNFEWVNWHAAKPGRLVGARTSACVVVRVDPKLAPGDVVIARGEYRPPFHHTILVAAVRTRRHCAAPLGTPAKAP